MSLHSSHPSRSSRRNFLKLASAAGTLAATKRSRPTGHRAVHPTGRHCLDHAPRPPRHNRAAATAGQCGISSHYVPGIPRHRLVSEN